MIYGVLGELEIGQQSRFPELPSRHSLIVLAALLINVNRRLSKAELMRVAWDDAEVDERQLHKSAAALHKLLDKYGRRSDLVTHARQGYEMRVSEDDLDMLQFNRLIRNAAQADSDGRADDEIHDLRQAFRLWRGHRALSNVLTDAFQQEVADLEQRRKRAAVRLFDLEIGRRNYDRILDDLMSIAGHYPTDRRLCEQLMLVSYRCGHATDAMAAYERYRAMLMDQTAVDPDQALRSLSYAISRSEDQAIAVVETAISDRIKSSVRVLSPEHETTVAPAVTVPRQLPPDPAGFVGRAALVAEATWLLGRQPGRTVPVVVISGPGGIGKTALALRVSHLSSDRYADGQLYVELRGTTGQPADTSEILAQLLRAFGVTTVPERKAERISLYRTLLADRRVLVVLDDAVDGAQISDLIPANPGCGVLVTARRRLPDLGGAHHVPPLEPLDHAAAKELFLYLVGSSGIDLRADLDSVDKVVALCGGLPLALRIAAALRVDDHPRPTAELAERLARQGPDAFAYGKHSVARTIGAGFDRLDNDARRLFLGLGSLQLPTFGLWTAAVLLHETGVDPAVTLSKLAASNMIELVESQVRYRFHDLTREYAQRRARIERPGKDDRHAMLAQVYRALLTLTRRAHTGLYGGDFEVIHSAVPDWDAPLAVFAEVDSSPLDWFEKERLNIRAVVEDCARLGLNDICWDLAVSAHEFYTVRGYFDDWYATHTVALRTCQQAQDGRGEGIVLACLGQPALVASRHGSGISGIDALRRAVGLLAQCGDRHGQAIALRTLANALRRRGELAVPLALFKEALTHYEASGDTVGQWQTLRFIGQTHLDRRDHAEALDVLRKAESVAGALGEGRLLAQTRYWIGQVCLATDDLAGAEAAFREVLDVYGAPTGVGHAYAAHGLGDMARRVGAFREAEQYLGVAVVLAHDGADAILEGRVCLSWAALHGALGQPEQQVATLERAVRCFADCGAAYLEAQALSALGRAQADRANNEAARAAWAQVDQLYTALALPEEDRVHRRPRREVP